MTLRENARNVQLSPSEQKLERERKKRTKEKRKEKKWEEKHTVPCPREFTAPHK
jgi:hypothetical protein